MKDDAAGARRAWQGLEAAVLDAVGVESAEAANPEQRLVATLLKVDALHQATVGRSDSANIERYGWLMTVKNCIDLINDNPDLRAHKLAAPLVRLQAALEDLDRGRTHPALRPVKRSRKELGPRSRLQSAGRGHLAGIVEGLMRRAEMSEPEAAHWVLRRLSAHGVRLTREQLIQWRKEVRGKKTDNFMRSAYHKANAVDWHDPIPTAERLIDGFLRLI